MQIDHQIPRLPFVGKEAGWRATTNPQFLRADHFPEATARRGVHFNDGKDRGRTLYLSHIPPRQARRAASYRGQTVVALSWHVDSKKRAPLLVTNLAIRGDSKAHRDLSRAGAGWLMAYLLEVARITGRGTAIGVEIATQPNREDFEAMGSAAHQHQRRSCR